MLTIAWYRKHFCVKLCLFVVTSCIYNTKKLIKKWSISLRHCISQHINGLLCRSYAARMRCFLNNITSLSITMHGNSREIEFVIVVTEHFSLRFSASYITRVSSLCHWVRGGLAVRVPRMLTTKRPTGVRIFGVAIFFPGWLEAILKPWRLYQRYKNAGCEIQLKLYFLLFFLFNIKFERALW